MSKQIVFDGDFNEADVEWIDEPDYDESGGWYPDEYLKKIGCVKYRDIITEGYTLRVYSFLEREGSAWYVVVEEYVYDFSFVIDGRVNFLRFLASPLVAQEVVTQTLALLKRAFRAWHGHYAPTGDNDHSVSGSCNECDPEGAWERQEERKRRIELRAERERLRAEEKSPT